MEFYVYNSLNSRWKGRTIKLSQLSADIEYLGVPAQQFHTKEDTISQTLLLCFSGVPQKTNHFWHG